MLLGCLMIFSFFTAPVFGIHKNESSSDAIVDQVNRLREELHQETETRIAIQTEMQGIIEQQALQISQLQTLNNYIEYSNIDLNYDLMESEPNDRFTALGCLDDIITLSCPDARTLWVTNAFYGRYNYTCSTPCCPPSPSRDCIVQVEQCEPNDWIALKYTCDNKTSCDWQYTGRVVDECEAGYVADYMQIFFDCLPGDTNESVGFTSHATSNREYQYHETVVFEEVQSNFGGHFNGKTCSFQCPFHGIYLFSVSFNAFMDYQMNVEIVRNGVILAEALAEDLLETTDLEYVYNHASAIVIVECDIGQTVLARAGTEAEINYLQASTNKQTQFVGYLLTLL